MVPRNILLRPLWDEAFFARVMSQTGESCWYLRNNFKTGCLHTGIKLFLRYQIGWFSSLFDEYRDNENEVRGKREVSQIHIYDELKE